MDLLVTLNLAGYAAVTVGGFAVGALFGRKLTAEFMAAVHAAETRLAAIETELRLGHAGDARATAHALAAHAAATEKLAAALAAPHAASAASAPAAHQGHGAAGESA